MTYHITCHKVTMRSDSTTPIIYSVCLFALLRCRRVSYGRGPAGGGGGDYNSPERASHTFPDASRNGLIRAGTRESNSAKPILIVIHNARVFL